MARQPDLRTLKDVQIAHRKSLRSFARKTGKALKHSCLSSHDEEILDALLGRKSRLTDWMPASHGRLRRHLLKLLIKEVVEVTREAAAAGKLFHVTVLHDAWGTGDLNPVVNLNAIRQKVRRALRPLDASYLAMIEVETFRNVYYSKGERLVSFHVHLLAWGGLLDREALQAKLIPQFESPGAVKGSQAKQVKSAKVQRVTPTDVNVAWLLQYLLKMPEKSKSLYRNVEHTRAYVNTPEKSDRYVVSLRLAEILSLIELSALLFAGGDGIAIRRRVMARLRKWVAASATRPIRGLASLKDLPNFWKGFKERQGLQRFKAPIIRQ